MSPAIPGFVGASSGTLLGVLFALGAALAVSFMALAIRKGTDAGDPTGALVIVIATNIVLFVPATVIVHHPQYHLVLEAIAAFAAAGIVGTLLGRLFTYTSVSRIGASRTEPIKSSQPLHATLIAIVVLHETVSVGHMVGILLIIVGIGVISWETASGDSTVESVKPYELGFPLLGAFFYGIEPVFAKLGFAQGTPVLVGLSIKTVTAFAAVSVYLRLRGSVPWDLNFTGENLRWYAAAGVLNTLFLFFYYLGLEVAPVSVVIPIVTTSPLLVAILSYLFLPQLERVTPQLVAAASVVVVGAVTVTLYG